MTGGGRHDARSVSVKTATGLRLVLPHAEARTMDLRLKPQDVVVALKLVAISAAVARHGRSPISRGRSTSARAR